MNRYIAIFALMLAFVFAGCVEKDKAAKPGGGGGGGAEGGGATVTTTKAIGDSEKKEEEKKEEEKKDGGNNADVTKFDLIMTVVKTVGSDTAQFLPFISRGEESAEDVEFKGMLMKLYKGEKEFAKGTLGFDEKSQRYNLEGDKKTIDAKFEKDAERRVKNLGVDKAVFEPLDRKDKVYALAIGGLDVIIKTGGIKINKSENGFSCPEIEVELSYPEGSGDTKTASWMLSLADGKDDTENLSVSGILDANKPIDKINLQPACDALKDHMTVGKDVSLTVIAKSKESDWKLTDIHLLSVESAVQDHYKIKVTETEETEQTKVPDTTA